MGKSEALGNLELPDNLAEHDEEEQMAEDLNHLLQRDATGRRQM